MSYTSGPINLPIYLYLIIFFLIMRIFIISVYVLWTSVFIIIIIVSFNWKIEFVKSFSFVFVFWNEIILILFLVIADRESVPNFQWCNNKMIKWILKPGHVGWRCLDKDAGFAGWILYPILYSVWELPVWQFVWHIPSGSPFSGFVYSMFHIRITTYQSIWYFKINRI